MLKLMNKANFAAAIGLWTYESNALDNTCDQQTHYMASSVLIKCT